MDLVPDEARVPVDEVDAALEAVRRYGRAGKPASW
jgi:hypothetical protein